MADLDGDAVAVLVVDDEADVAETTAAHLRRTARAPTVDTATSAEAGLDRLEAADYDCVVSDYSMPGMDGLAFFEAVSERFPTLPFILFTGKGSEEIASRAISAGVTDYLQKTGSAEQFERLANRVAHATTARRSERDAEASRAHLQAIVDNATDVIVTIDAASVVRFVSGSVEAVLGYAPEEVVGEPLTMLMPERHRETHLAAVDRYLETGERRADWSQFEIEGRHRAGHEVPLSVSFGEFTLDGERRFTGIMRDVTDRRRRERRLAELNDLLAAFVTTDDRGALCGAAVETAADRLDLPLALIALLDTEGRLEPAARSPDAADRLDDGALLARDGGVGWRAFAGGEPAEADDPGSSAHLLAYPLGRHGVFLAGVEDPAGLDEETVDVVETVVNGLRGALDRLDREAALREREAALAERTDRLDQLNRLNDVIRRIDRALVDATSREDAEETVCAELVADPLYRFAWIGGLEATADRVTPRVFAGAGDDPSGLVDADGVDPATRAARTGEPVSVPEVLDDPPLEGWREVALERNLRSCLAVPIAHRDRLYGVLAVYAGEPDGFDELERSVLVEFGATIAHAINAIESTRALVSDEVIELEFELDPTAFPLLEVLTETPGSAAQLEGVVPAADGTYRVYLTVYDAADGLDERLAALPTVEACTRLAAWEGTWLLECRVGGSGLIGWLLDYGAVPRSVSTNGAATATVELDREADVRSFVELLQAAHPGTELIARRERRRGARTREGFLAELGGQLTDRQLEVLQHAYFSGFFESPRQRTGEEVAASLGIAQPTFSDHLRAAHRKLLGRLFEGDREP